MLSHAFLPEKLALPIKYAHHQSTQRSPARQVERATAPQGRLRATGRMLREKFLRLLLWHEAIGSY